ncbi:MAG TPA: hypothetical protein VFH56_17125 [Acidimicrobiales bacterium]|nr:hypothetical protein [Acidimicrobiales bacterium]
MEAAHALEAIRSLSVEDLRRRLAEIDAEAESLRALLRAAIARDRRRARLAESEKGGDDAR